MRRKGTVERYAWRTVAREKGLSERRSATVGYVPGDEGGDGKGASEGERGWRCHTPSISRTYLGLNFFFSALHWARTRSRRRSRPCGSGNAPGLDSVAKGSHHHPTRSIPPSDLPPTRRRAIEKWACNSWSERCSKAVPRCTADSFIVRGGVVGGRAEESGCMVTGIQSVGLFVLAMS